MSEKILFVDNEVQIMNSMKRQLRKRFQVVTAESGQEALEITWPVLQGLQDFSRKVGVKEPVRVLENTK